VPSGLTASPGDGQVVLNWNANTESDLQGYNVYRGTAKLNAAPIAATTYTAAGLTNGTAYAFQISAVDASGNESAKSAVVNSTPQAASTVIVDGNASDWTSAAALNASASGSIAALKARNDGTYLYLLVKGSGLNVKSQFYLNTDNNTSTGYNPTGWAASGIDALLENQSLYAYSGTNNGWQWSLASTLSASQFVRNDTVIELSIPLSSLGLTSGKTIRIGYICNDSAANLLPANGGAPFSYTLQ